MVANGFLQFLLGPAMHMILESVSGTPQLSHNMGQSADDLVILVVFYAWMILQLLPVMVETLVYEKQQKLRIMMGMHGLGNGAYWFIMYMYFLIVSSLYMCCYLLSGTLTRRRIFTMNSFSLQCTFYFIYINLQITTSFLLALLFKRVRTASVCSCQISHCLRSWACWSNSFSDLVGDASINSEIGQLFVAGFGSSVLFGTIVGSLADKQGRRRACITYCITYTLSCITKHSPQYKVLMIGPIKCVGS